MKKTLLILSAAAAFMTASCSENKTAETTTSADGTTTTTTTTTAQTAYTPEAIERRADRIAADMAAKMKFDDATRTKIRTAYVTRGQRIAELQTKYATDTVGMAAAMQGVYTDTDTEMKTIFTDPTQYSAYESSRTDYMEDRYMEDDSNMATSDMSSADASASSAEMGDGSKVKVKADGDVKIKDAEGNKMKMDGDDGTVKMKPEEGDKSVIK
ncbi:hypothetical protein [Hymenobacter swuensis]|uniref:Lipoprotein n=1 Tax=Hymenobacter swuensis DY53 TaxID=1227739 RepID=W8F344_9BACT|nr:hypothetical protein [Hymenobacter swuensis]AHJ96225.1 hypothetical protein Hsw_0630 [Hymenobacter swuensis DY53]